MTTTAHEDRDGGFSAQEIRAAALDSAARVAPRSFIGDAADLRAAADTVGDLTLDLALRFEGYIARGDTLSPRKQAEISARIAAELLADQAAPALVEGFRVGDRVRSVVDVTGDGDGQIGTVTGVVHATPVGYEVEFDGDTTPGSWELQASDLESAPEPVDDDTPPGLPPFVDDLARRMALATGRTLTPATAGLWRREAEVAADVIQERLATLSPWMRKNVRGDVIAMYTRQDVLDVLSADVAHDSTDPGRTS